MRTLVAVAALALALPLPASGQTPVRYDVSFPEAEHHVAEITVRFGDLDTGPLDVRMPRSSPGRYALHEFAKNVYDFRAEDGEGQPLAVTRPDPYGWTVAHTSGPVTVRYRLFGDYADGTYDGIDRTHAHLNMPATFAYAPSQAERPIRITFHLPAGSKWKVATQLEPVSGDTTFSAPDLQYFMDSPTEVSDFDVREWDETARPDGGPTYHFRIALHHVGSAAALDSFAARAQKIVEQERAVYGELAPYDYGHYTFIADYLPWVHGDGMEHRNSTILTSTRSLDEARLRNLQTLAHEFFHSWNIERIRPRGIEPFDFQRANMTGALWFGEGFTSYYQNVFVTRAGYFDAARYGREISGTLSYVLEFPGRRFRTPVEMSQLAPLVDAASWVDETDWQNTFISYYSYGTTLGLGLDLMIRSRYPGRSLDDVMRLMWKRFGKTEIPYALGDVQEAVADATGDSAFADGFFRRYVYGHELPDYGKLLTRAGFLLRKAHPGSPSIGFTNLSYGEGGATLASPALLGSPLYDAGVAEGDRILSLGGIELHAREDLERALADHSPGDTLEVVFAGEGQRISRKLVLGEDESLEVVPFEKAGRTPSAEQKRFREAWLGPK